MEKDASVMHLTQTTLYLLLLITAAVGTSIAYHLLEKGWISYRAADNALAARQFAKAADLFERSYQEGVHDPKLMSRAAEAYFSDRNFPKAIAWYQLYLQKKPNDPWAKRALAGALTANGNLEEAQKIYEELLLRKEEP